MAADAAHHSLAVVLGGGPALGRVVRHRGVAFEAGVILAAAGEAQGDDVEGSVIMAAAGGGVHIETENGNAVDDAGFT